jgi:hypothetical protein
VAFVGLFWAIVLGGLLILALSVAATCCRRATCCSSVRGAFWAVFVPAVVLMSSAVVGLLGVQSYSGRARRLGGHRPDAAAGADERLGARPHRPGVPPRVTETV